MEPSPQIPPPSVVLDQDAIMMLETERARTAPPGPQPGSPGSDGNRALTTQPKRRTKHRSPAAGSPALARYHAALGGHPVTLLPLSKTTGLPKVLSKYELEETLYRVYTVPMRRHRARQEMEEREMHQFMEERFKGRGYGSRPPKSSKPVGKGEKKLVESLYNRQLAQREERRRLLEAKLQGEKFIMDTQLAKKIYPDELTNVVTRLYKEATQHKKEMEVTMDKKWYGEPPKPKTLRREDLNHINTSLYTDAVKHKAETMQRLEEEQTFKPRRAKITKVGLSCMIDRLTGKS